MNWNTHGYKGSAAVGLIFALRKISSVTNMTNAISRFAEAQMLIRKPPSQVFEAFIDPSITKNFWFTKGSDRLTLNKKITWTWEMYNLSTTVTAKEIIENEKILFEWDTPPRMVEF